MSGRIKVGIGGWTFEPWRGTFYPQGWPKARELEYASTHVTAIEINGTFYSTQKPATWADWAKRTPDDFTFTVKASRFCTNRRVLCDGAESIDKFINQGLAELGPKLGPILWQFAATKQFDPQDFGGFLDQIRCPTLIATGEADAGSNPRMARYMHERIPGSTLSILPGLRHSILIEAPEMVANLMRGFLTREETNHG